MKPLIQWGITEFILEDRLGEIDPQSGEALVKTSYKRPKLRYKDFDIRIDDEDDVDMKQWEWVEEHFKSDRTRLLDLDGHVGHPPPDMHCITLWKRAQLVDNRLRVLMAYVQGTLNTNVEQAWVAVVMASEMARKASTGATCLQENTGLKKCQQPHCNGWGFVNPSSPTP